MSPFSLHRYVYLSLPPTTVIVTVSPYATIAAVNHNNLLGFRSKRWWRGRREEEAVLHIWMVAAVLHIWMVAEKRFVSSEMGNKMKEDGAQSLHENYI
ncbi:transmembrane protein, putative [Medicago truncatula]|uniref:Transmembrane protein, putative n=1 Tax=Medicago truncatula TaxID=3880 RepID=A0A072VQR7_MEDTR|nr:transmembrane protein, putative [Medicago truncatula]